MLRSFVVSAVVFFGMIGSANAVSLLCEDGYLVNSRGQTIASFDFQSQCEEAIRTMRGDYLCAPGRTTNFDLMDVYGYRYHGFTFKSQCQQALVDVEMNDGLACMDDVNSGVIMRDVVRYKVLHVFTFTSECSESLRQNKEHGLFCARAASGDYQLKNWDGRVMGEYTFESQCMEARNKVLGGGRSKY